MARLIKSLGISFRGSWQNCMDDSASLSFAGKRIFFTTDSFIVDPVFFPGGNIGDLAFCGTVNDLAVMGAEPLGISLAMILEEGFPRSELEQIMGSIRSLSKRTGIPIATGDTKVTLKGKLDRIAVNTAGIGAAERVLDDKPGAGDRVILSGGLAEHTVALLSIRFNYKTDIVSDTKPIIEELRATRQMLKCAKDITRGGLASALNELCGAHGIGMLLDEQAIPVRPAVRRVTEMLGIDIYELACEGRFVCIATKQNAAQVEQVLRRFNPMARVIGEVTRGQRVAVQTSLGRRIMPMPTGRIVPRIC